MWLLTTCPIKSHTPWELHWYPSYSSFSSFSNNRQKWWRRWISSPLRLSSSSSRAYPFFDNYFFLVYFFPIYSFFSIYSFLDSLYKKRCQIWLYEQANVRLEGQIVVFLSFSVCFHIFIGFWWIYECCSRWCYWNEHQSKDP